MAKDKFAAHKANLDKDHEELHAALEHLESALGGAGSAGEAFVDLKEHVQAHFQREEALLAAMQYPGKDAHHIQHETILDVINQFEERYRAELSEDEAMAALQFLKGLVEEHSEHSDAVIAEYMGAQQILDRTRDPATQGK